MEEKIYFKKLIYIPEFRMAINVREINRIDKLEKCVNGNMSYGIAINRGDEPQQKIQSQNIEHFYNSESERDERFNQLLVEFEAIGINIIEV